MEGLLSNLQNMSITQNKLVVFHHHDTLLHQSMKKHPEQPDRISVILNVLKKIEGVVIKNANQVEEYHKNEEIEELIKQNHGVRYLEFVQEMWDPDSKRTEMYINRDTYYCKNTYKAALAAAKTSVTAATYALNHNTNTFAVVRPPGHHSGLKTQPHGFSFINNVALAAKKVIKEQAVSRVAIVDWDAHHGEGTQTIFYDSNQVLYISLHRFDHGKFFPHLLQSGSNYSGQGKGKGFNVNICWNLPEKHQETQRLPSQTAGDDEYIKAFQTIVMPILKQFNPELILVSCGFDSAVGDHIGGLRLTSDGFVFMTQELSSLNKPISFILEGGYDLKILEWSSLAVVKGLIEQRKDLKPNQCNKIGQQGIEACLKEVGSFWKSLNP